MIIIVCQWNWFDADNRWRKSRNSDLNTDVMRQFDQHVSRRNRNNLGVVVGSVVVGGVVVGGVAGSVVGGVVVVGIVHSERPPNLHLYHNYGFAGRRAD